MLNLRNRSDIPAIEGLLFDMHGMVDELCEFANFDEYLNGEVTFDEWIHENRRNIPNDINCANGMTRFVFWRTEDPIAAFKISICSSADYNKSEAFVYEKACEANLQEWFAWTFKLTTLEFNGHDIDVYAQEYCEPDEDMLYDVIHTKQYERALADRNVSSYSELSEEEQNAVDDECCFSGDSESMQEYVTDTYGLEATDNLFDFLYKMRVNDTHSGNWGFRDSNHIVLIDFGGYGLDIFKELGEGK